MIKKSGLHLIHRRIYLLLGNTVEISQKIIWTWGCCWLVEEGPSHDRPRSCVCLSSWRSIGHQSGRVTLFVRIYPFHLSSSLKGKICLFVTLISYLLQLLHLFFFYWSLQKSNMFISFNQILDLIVLPTGFIFFICFCFDLCFFFFPVGEG